MTNTRTINLALQGGGSHGAFTWGVLDRLLAEPGLELEGISGSSSGAMNAVMLAHGLLHGGRDGAREMLTEFWQEIADAYNDLFQPAAQTSEWPMFDLDLPLSLQTYLALTYAFSPYQINPFNHNPLRHILEKRIDFEALRSRSPVQLFIGATQVRTGKLKVFTTEQLTADTLLASACLPSLHHAIVIEGESYWDGGFSGNPPVFPLIFENNSHDVIVVILQPLERPELPTTADAIRMRATELSFNTTFLREMRAIAFSKQYIDRAWLPPLGSLERRLDRLNIHLIQSQAVMEKLDNQSRYSSAPELIQKLYEEGYAAAELWLENNSAHIGKRSTVNLAEQFC